MHFLIFNKNIHFLILCVICFYMQIVFKFEQFICWFLKASLIKHNLIKLLFCDYTLCDKYDELTQLIHKRGKLDNSKNLDTNLI